MPFSAEDEKEIRAASDQFFNNLNDFEKRWVLGRVRGDIDAETLLNAPGMDAVFAEKILSETEDVESASFENRLEIAEFRWLSRACARLQKQEFNT
jgi:hypothetical protein